MKESSVSWFFDKLSLVNLVHFENKVGEILAILFFSALRVYNCSYEQVYFGKSGEGID